MAARGRPFKINQDVIKIGGQDGEDDRPVVVSKTRADDIKHMVESTWPSLTVDIAKNYVTIRRGVLAESVNLSVDDRTIDRIAERLANARTSR